MKSLNTIQIDRAERAITKQVAVLDRITARAEKSIAVRSRAVDDLLTRNDEERVEQLRAMTVRRRIQDALGL